MSAFEDLVGHRYDPRVEVVVSFSLPLSPSFKEDIRRQVRWGLKDILDWCGIPVGPRPGEPTHALMIGGVLFVSRELERRLQIYWETPLPERPLPDDGEVAR